MIKPLVVFLLVALVAGGVGFLAARHLNPASPAVQPLDTGASNNETAGADLLGQRRPDFTHLDINGKPVSADDFDGRPLLVNFWATWCQPCVDEMPMLSDIQADRGPDQLAVIGIALDDEDRARAFARELEIGYTILLGKTDVVLTGRRYGNHSGLLPFTVLVDAQGIVRWTRLGALKREDLELQLEKLQ